MGRLADERAPRAHCCPAARERGPSAARAARARHEWGETRFSHVHETSFARADDARPFATALLHYNDRAGVDALIGYHGVSGRSREYAARGGAITISVRDGSGDPLEAVHVGGPHLRHRAGRRAIHHRDGQPHRPPLEVVTTVDGLDVLNGQAGTLANRGYILMPYARLEIDGFRQTQDAVAAFRFGRVADSYAARTGSARNVGVIGLAFFAERGDDYSEDELRTRDSADPFPGEGTRFARPPR